VHDRGEIVQSRLRDVHDRGEVVHSLRDVHDRGDFEGVAVENLAAIMHVA
jgi:hypothetical protein